MDDVVNLPISLESDLGRELIVDCVRFAEGILTEQQVRKKFRFDAGAWEALGSNEELIEKIEAEKLRRMRDGSTKREKAQLLVVKAPDVVAAIMNDDSANARHRIDSAKVLNDFAAPLAGAGTAAGSFFEITINLGADQDGKPVVEHYRKPRAIDINPTDTDTSSDRNDADPDPHSIIAAIAAKKLITESGGGEPV